jgi:hypothetical protein
MRGRVGHWQGVSHRGSNVSSEGDAGRSRDPKGPGCTRQAAGKAPRRGIGRIPHATGWL